MGALGNQDERNFRKIDTRGINTEIGHIRKIAQENGISYMEVVETMKLMEQERMGDLFVDSGDKMDENLGGLGEHFANLISATYGQ